MARIRKKKLNNGIFSKIKFTESYTSLILGGIVVFIVGILFVFLARGNKNTQTSSVSEGPAAEQSLDKKLNASSTYTVKPGDDLWSISENIYRDGYKWTEIAKTNKLEDPNLIYSGDKLVMPVATEKNILPNEIVKNNSIAENNYTVKSGDNLWDIAVRAYGDGFKWAEIANANNLANPNLIHAGNVFKIPR